MTLPIFLPSSQIQLATTQASASPMVPIYVFASRSNYMTGADIYCDPV